MKAWHNDGSEPHVRGWFAVLHTWDPHEGTFPDAAWYSALGWLWSRGSTIVAYAGPFDSEQDARQWADAHDPGY